MLAVVTVFVTADFVSAMITGAWVYHMTTEIALIEYVLSNLLGLIPLIEWAAATSMRSVLTEAFATDPLESVNASKGMKAKVVLAPLALMIALDMETANTSKT